MLGISILVVLYVYDAGISPNAAVVLNEYPMTRIVPERDDGGYPDRGCRSRGIAYECDTQPGTEYAPYACY